jgi:N-methylhydantoinase B
MNPGAENRVLPSKFTMIIKRGDVFSHDSAGPGGWGDPLERDPARVARDVKNEFVSRRSAHDDYGVVFAGDGFEVDLDATAARRDVLRRERGWTEAPGVSR